MKVKEIDDKWTRPSKSELLKKLLNALFTREGKGIWSWWFLISRFTWELPQHILGIGFSLFTLAMGWVRDVYTYEGSIVVLRDVQGKKGALLKRNKYLSYLSGVSLGSFLCIAGRASEQRLQAITQHEYGHYLQSQRAGWLYLLVIGLPSIISASQGSRFHRKMWWERNANELSASFHKTNDLAYIPMA